MTAMFFMGQASGDPWANLDGRLNAPSGAAQHPSLLSGYVARPPWKVSGVDYAVGYPSGAALTDWQSISNPNVTIGTNLVTVTANTTLDSIDFSLHGGAQILVNSGVSALTISNSQFGGTSYGSIATAVIDSRQTSGSLTVKYCVIDGGGSTTGNAQLIAPTGAIDILVQYNWLKNSPSEVLSLNGASSLNYCFNLIENNCTHTADHLNALQWASATTSSAPLVAFNTMLQNQVLSVGEGFQFYGNNGGTIIGPVCTNNTMVAPAGTGQTVSSFMHGSSGTGTNGTVLSGTGQINDNYFDITEGGAFYPGSFSGWTASGNINMVNGSTLTPT